MLQLCFYTEQLARIQGRWPERDARRQRARRARELPAGRLLRLLPAAAGAVPRRGRRTGSRPTPTRSTTARSASSSRSARSSGSGTTTSRSSPGSGGRRSTGSPPRASRPSRLSRRRSETKIPKLRAETLAKLRSRPRSSSTAGRPASSSTSSSRSSPSAASRFCPSRAPGDIWLDLEGDPWYEPQRGIEYLLGWVYLEDGEPRYDCIWGLDRAEEKAGFERLLDLICERRARFPGMHVYHYAPYERTALQRLMGEHGTREAELDDLLRGEVLVDLFRVVRQALRLSLPSYSIKEVEEFYGFERGEEMRGGGGAVVAFEEWLEARDGRDPRGDPRLQRGRLPLAVRAAPVAAAPAPGRRSSGARRPRSARSRRRRRSGSRSARGSRRSCSRARRRASRAGCSRTCSSTTGARRSRSGGPTSTTSRLDEEELFECDRGDGRARARRAGRGRAVVRVHVLVPGPGAQDRQRGGRPGDGEGATTSPSTTSTASSGCAGAGSARTSRSRAR